ncbi:hypothetical protein F4777DRAFT_23097 [Nemania sp. FL0916]|nr:hypothetical protein F4777DRAFT_23097 [Nemania sp. FL0916]
MEEANNDAPIVPVPPPWKLKGTIYVLTFWASKVSAAKGKGSGKHQRQHGLPTIAYSPLEASSSFADPAASGEYLGGLSQIQIIRYTEGPVGPYDELIICPGYWAFEKKDDKGKMKKMKNLRVPRIYVSQKYTCWNGRANWNIPKHLARFEWDESAEGKTSVRVYPHDTARASGNNYGTFPGSSPGEKPFFQATFQPMRWAPSFPLSFSWMKYVGIDASLVQPPLPDGRQSNNSQIGEELIGTSRWCKILPELSTRKAVLGWMDMSQSQHDQDSGDDDDDAAGSSRNTSDAEYANFWPGMRRWNMAFKMENADIVFGEGQHWDPS